MKNDNREIHWTRSERQTEISIHMEEKQKMIKAITIELTKLAITFLVWWLPLYIMETIVESIF